MNESPAVIGRNSPDVPLTDNTVSRRHSELIRKSDDSWVIRDLGSANGTFVNGVKLSGFLDLKQGDQVRCGATLIVFGQKRTGSGIICDPVSLQIDPDGNLIESSIMGTTPGLDDSVIIAGPETSSAVGNLRLLYELSTTISSIFDESQLLDKVMDIVFDNLPADRGFILLREQEDKPLVPMAARYRDESQKDSGKITVSHTIVEHAMEKREGVICTNAMRDPRFAKGESVHNYAIRSALCVPIAVRSNVMGVIYVDTTMATNTYAGEQLELLTAIGYQTGLALENARLYQSGVRAERLAATGETVAYISHGIKNILQGMQSATDLVDMGFHKNKMEVAGKGWKVVKRNLTRVQNLMLNMLAYSKVRKPNKEMSQLNHLVAEAVDLLSENAHQKGVGLFSDLDSHLPPIPMDADGIQQVLLNLILNAFDVLASGEGVITVKTSYNIVRGNAMLIVSDNGPGIAPDELGEIFTAFHSSKGHGGTGLGLAVVKKIVEEHDGTVTVDSKIGEGTTFTVSLPTATTLSSGETASDTI
ncbi:MAG: FHA domain-containing protein [Sedimentisphaerales bacterium]|nr:FHA domain-containing protein [Sedimentisphaerales bacterium]MBN2842347.1 FHA domain-containing protein [Sedimentisphaerales bacterium]